MGEELLGIIPARKELHAIDRLKAEQVLEEKFGHDALRVYVKINGARNAEEIRGELAMDEKKFLEILGFLEDGGLITTKTVFEAEFEQKPEKKI
ncbi:MAG: hypothetical protein Q7T16_01955 [Candidatus Burarchaeum sp.]|nr:hypothetical protein [Candidatus Burarchaeum sp.]MDO8339397.1 hypothetical protein [Candidatus Burarchaeum sp.]